MRQTDACVLVAFRAIWHFSFESIWRPSRSPWQMTLLTAAFYYMAAASTASALLAVTRKHPVHAMLWVLTLFLHVAGIFLLVGAEFLAAVQVIVYAGAILIFYVFIVMLLDLPDEEAKPRFGRHWPIAAGLRLCFPAVVLLARVGNGIA